MKVSGEYNEDGYRILADGEEVYSAGNNPQESQSYSSEGLPLKTLRAFCIQTAREIADENNGDFLGVQRVDNYS